MAKCRTRNCSNEFVQYSTLQNLCVPCLIKKGRKIEKKTERKEHREAKERVKRKSDWMSEAQVAFNKFIRISDYEQPCISCGRYDSEIIYNGFGGKWDCGHFKTRGAFPELRFILFNAHKQCKSCNSGSYYHAHKKETVAKQYEQNLIIKIGQDNVDWLNGPHEPKNYTIDDLKEIKKGFNQWARELEKEINNA